MFEMIPIGWVHGGRTEAIDDDWGSVDSRIVLDETVVGPGSIAGLEEFSHVEVVFVFDRVELAAIVHDARHPRGNTSWPEVGIFAQRAKARPNRIGITTCELLATDGTTLHVRGLDAIDGTPVLDIKPYMIEFAPRSAVRQPNWSSELMVEYWSSDPRT